MGSASITIERNFAAPADLVWALLGDTGRFDRAMGLGLPAYRWAVVDGRRVHIGKALQNGLQVEWIEPPYQWVEGRRMIGTRQFIKGPASSGGIEIEVEPEGPGARARVRVWGDADQWYMTLLRPLMLSQLRKRATAYLDSVSRLLETDALPPDDGSPAASRAAALCASKTMIGGNGATTPMDRDELDRRVARLRALRPGGATEALVAWISERPDEDVAQMQPFVLARSWGHDRRELLRTFLHATHAGLTELQWQINCPVCRVSASVATGLDEIGRQVHCDACNISYDVDFGRSVEAVFRCHPAVRAVSPAVFCAASPMLRPHVIAQLCVEPGKPRREVVALAHGSMIVRTLGAHRPAEHGDAGVPKLLRVRVAEGAVTLAAEGSSDDGRCTLHLETGDPEPVHVVVERGTWASDAVLGSAVASLPEFMELFATDAPAAGLELTVGRLTLLFSDLTGSTALYERIGDARAFAVVQEHFRDMTAIVAQHDGAVVKTMGDAVMASFAKAADAARAAIAMVEATARSAHADAVGVKLGIHEGPCLAVRANDRLDFFGTTVNVAARLQAQARAAELVLTSELATSLDALLGTRAQRRFRAALKGIRAEQDLIGVDLSPDAGASPPRS